MAKAARNSLSMVCASRSRRRHQNSIAWQLRRRTAREKKTGATHGRFAAFDCDIEEEIGSQNTIHQQELAPPTSTAFVSIMQGGQNAYAIFALCSDPGDGAAAESVEDIVKEVRELVRPRREGSHVLGANRESVRSARNSAENGKSSVRAITRKPCMKSDGSKHSFHFAHSDRAFAKDWIQLVRKFTQNGRARSTPATIRVRIES